jgi:hypothetical protein
MLRKLLFIYLPSLILFGCKTNFDETAVAQINNNNSFEINTEKAKTKVLDDLKANVKEFQVDTTEIMSVIPIGDKYNKVYFLQLTDRKQNLKLTRYLFLKDKNLYFYEDLKGKKPADDNMFFVSYYSVAGKPGSACTPNIAYSEGELFWITGNALVCAKDSPCTSQQHLVIK